MTEPTVTLTLTLENLVWVKLGLNELFLAGEDVGNGLLETVDKALEKFGKTDQYEGIGHDAGDF